MPGCAAQQTSLGPLKENDKNLLWTVYVLQQYWMELKLWLAASDLGDQNLRTLCNNRKQKLLTRIRVSRPRNLQTIELPYLLPLKRTKATSPSP